MFNINSLHNCGTVIENANETLDPSLYPVYALKIRKNSDTDVKLSVNVAKSDGTHAWFDVSTGGSDVSNVLRYKGTCDFENLPISGMSIGDVYNISNAFDLYDIHYSEGTNIVWDGSMWDSFVGDEEDKEKTSNKVTSIDNSATDDQYPSAKAVYDAIQEGGGGSASDNVYDLGSVPDAVLTLSTSTYNKEIVLGYVKESSSNPTTILLSDKYGSSAIITSNGNCYDTYKVCGNLNIDIYVRKSSSDSTLPNSLICIHSTAYDEDYKIFVKNIQRTIDSEEYFYVVNDITTLTVVPKSDAPLEDSMEDATEEESTTYDISTTAIKRNIYKSSSEMQDIDLFELMTPLTDLYDLYEYGNKQVIDDAYNVSIAPDLKIVHTASDTTTDLIELGAIAHNVNSGYYNEPIIVMITDAKGNYAIVSLGEYASTNKNLGYRYCAGNLDIKICITTTASNISCAYLAIESTGYNIYYVKCLQTYFSAGMGIASDYYYYYTTLPINEETVGETYNISRQIYSNSDSVKTQNAIIVSSTNYSSISSLKEKEITYFDFMAWRDGEVDIYKGDTATIASFDDITSALNNGIVMLRNTFGTTTYILNYDNAYTDEGKIVGITFSAAKHNFLNNYYSNVKYSDLYITESNAEDASGNAVGDYKISYLNPAMTLTISDADNYVYINDTTTKLNFQDLTQLLDQYRLDIKVYYKDTSNNDYNCFNFAQKTSVTVNNKSYTAYAFSNVFVTDPTSLLNPTVMGYITLYTDDATENAIVYRNTTLADDETSEESDDETSEELDDGAIKL